MQSGGLAFWLILIGHVMSTGAAAAEPIESVGPFDLLVIAPHSDDEAIGCTGVILRAVAKKQRVGIVVVTAGDGFPKAAAAAVKKDVSALIPQDFVDLATLRQRHTLEAMPRLGVRPSDILFLGYPDGGMTAMLESTDERPYRQPHTGRSQTYGTLAADYHMRRHGRAIPYCKQAVVDDLKEIISDSRPREIYVTSRIDTHPDHAALFHFVRDAAAAARYRGRLLTFVVHGAEPKEEPSLRIVLNADEQATKRRTIEIYQAGVSPVHDRLAEEYSKPEERFWEIPLPGLD
jgi:LmbE family N-acetylglucosaminyl deacetylase